MEMENANLENINVASNVEPAFLKFKINTPALPAVGTCDTPLRRTPIINDNKRNFQLFV